MTLLQRVEQHVIWPDDARWATMDEACWRSKNLWNAANYQWRQSFIQHGQHLSYEQLASEFKTQPDYCALPRKVSQWVLKQLDAAWQAFRAARTEYATHPAKFTARPALPKYKDAATGRNLLTYTTQALSQPALRQGVIQPSGLPIQVRTCIAPHTINQVRVVPRKDHYVVEVVYTVQPQPAPELNPAWVAGIDMGVDNLAAIASNQPGFVPLLVNGRPLKSLNHFYNRERARLQQALSSDLHHSRRLDALTVKRNFQVRHYLHLSSRRIVERLVEAGIGTLVIGHNPAWKQKVNLGKRTNQNFVGIPHTRFIDMLRYKAEAVGIQVQVIEESYTSKCSFLDDEFPAPRDHYGGRRIQRGLFRAGTGQLINADVNAALNLIRKAIPNAWADGIPAAVARPVRFTPA